VIKLHDKNIPGATSTITSMQNSSCTKVSSLPSNFPPRVYTRATARIQSEPTSSLKIQNFSVAGCNNNKDGYTSCQTWSKTSAVYRSTVVSKHGAPNK
jgi:hypothetical protein